LRTFLLHKVLRSVLYALHAGADRPLRKLLPRTTLARLHYLTENQNSADPIELSFLGHTLTSFNNYYWLLHSIKELFQQEVYKFKSDTETPTIIDCGSNIGLSVIYFKLLYPSAKIVAFEPDKTLYNHLIKNIQSFNLENVKAYQKGVWSDDKVLNFHAEGTLGGALGPISNAQSTTEVEVIRLKSLLSQRVDFLKLDIEGAEYEVLNDCKESLSNVRHLFVEYHSHSNRQQNLHEILKWITAAGMRYIIMDASCTYKHPFTEAPNKGPDLQLNIFCFRR
jgi:FkbM family methyltransferase